MTRIDFYVLSDSGDKQRQLFACRLTQKAHALGKQVYIAVNTPEEAQQLDEALWTFRPESFIPHDCEGEQPRHADVLIGYGEDCGQHHDVLINLRTEIPAFFSRFERLAEVVCQTEEVLDSTRKHYAFYRHRGYPIQSHKLDSA